MEENTKNENQEGLKKDQDTSGNADEKNKEIEVVLNLKKENEALKEKYEKLEKNYTKDKNDYFNKVINSGTMKPNDTKKYTEDDIKKLVNEISKKEMSNLDFWQTALELSDAWQEVKGKNLFNERGNNEDEASSIRVKTLLKNMVEESEGRPDTFRILYDKYVVDTNPNAKKTLL